MNWWEGILFVCGFKGGEVPLRLVLKAKRTTTPNHEGFPQEKPTFRAQKAKSKTPGAAATRGVEAAASLLRGGLHARALDPWSASHPLRPHSHGYWGVVCGG